MIINVLCYTENYFKNSLNNVCRNQKELYICVTKANNMNTTEIRKKVSDYMEVGFTMSEAFANIKDSLRERRKKSGHKLAEVVGTKASREGLEDGYNAKKYLH